MTIFLTGFVIVAILYLVLSLPTMGKFWHNHEWYVAYEHQAPSMYSKKS